MERGLHRVPKHILGSAWLYTYIFKKEKTIPLSI
jgi:hypothetical protein